jgi:hypothetical protein
MATDPRTRALTVRWTWVFLDVPGDRESEAVEFWTAVTRSRLSERRGSDGQFATFLPEHGDPWLKLQVVGGPGGTHLDLDIDDPEDALEVAQAHGAELDATFGDVLVMHSPGGYAFCLTPWPISGRPARQVREQATLVDQVCLDIPGDRYAAEVAFWSALTGWEARPSTVREEVHHLVRPRELPVRILLQRLGENEGRVRGHLDIACSDRPAAVREHVSLGAEVVGDEQFWSVMQDPTGQVYCLTDRHPQTGRLA